ncbi:hypothetical protein MMC25_000856 [Agyrium rufum]|nr:hypothetical protein [Agyrium rufum]
MLLGKRVVDESSSRVGTSAEEWQSVSADHEGMVRFANANDNTSKTVVANTKSLQKSLKLGDKIKRKDPAKIHFKIPTEKKISNFVGGWQVLIDISQQFLPTATTQRTDPTSIALVDMGGIGKTQLASKYCLTTKSQGSILTVFWIDAHFRDAVTMSLSSMAGYIGPRDQISSISTEEKDPAFDDILKYTPLAGPVTLLFTSRMQAVVGLDGSALDVDVLPEEDALDLLVTRSKVKKRQDVCMDPNVKGVVRLLDRLPLALDQAGAYIDERGGSRSLERFIDDYKQRPKVVQGRGSIPALQNWTKLFESSSRFDDAHYRSIVMELHNLSLIRGFTEPDEGELYFSMHSLLQDWARIRLGSKDVRRYNTEINLILERFFERHESKLIVVPDIVKTILDSASTPIDDTRLGNLVADMITELTTHLLPYQVPGGVHRQNHDESDHVDFYAAFYLTDVGEIDQAMILEENIVADAKRRHGPQDPLVLRLLSIMCRARTEYRVRPRDRMAMETFLEQIKDSNGAQHPEALLVRQTLAELYVNQDEMNLAMPTYEELSNDLQRLDINLQDETFIVASKTFVSARQWQNKVPLEFEDWLGPTRSALHMCDLRLAQNKLDEAEEAVWAMIRDGTQRLGESHPEVFWARGIYLSECYAKRERWTDEATEMERLYEYLSSGRGLRELLTQTCGLTLAGYWIRCLAVDSLRINALIEKVLGNKEGASMVQARDQLARTWKSVRNLSEAEGQYKLILQWKQTNFGFGDERTINTLISLAIITNNQCTPVKYLEAEILYS